MASICVNVFCLHHFITWACSADVSWSANLPGYDWSGWVCESYIQLDWHMHTWILATCTTCIYANCKKSGNACGITPDWYSHPDSFGSLWLGSKADVPHAYLLIMSQLISSVPGVRSVFDMVKACALGTTTQPAVNLWLRRFNVLVEDWPDRQVPWLDRNLLPANHFISSIIP